MTEAVSRRRGPKPNPQTRTNLLQVGVRLLHESGYNATGISDIVTAAGVPKGSFYNHFASKEAFGAEVVDTYFSGNLVSLRSLLQDADIPPLSRLRSYFAERAGRVRALGYERGCLLGNLSLEMADHSPQITERLAESFRLWASLLTDCIAEAQCDGSISGALPAATLAEVLLNSWEGALLRARVTKSHEPFEQFSNVIFDGVLAGTPPRT